jgi:hypothetical protein
MARLFAGAAKTLLEAFEHGQRAAASRMFAAFGLHA